jgi:diguanylate cyclase (GGDEF)-like protein
VAHDDSTVIDVAAGLSLVAEDRELYVRLLASFTRDADDVLSQLRAPSADDGSIGRALHRMRGSAGVIGAHRLVQATIDGEESLAAEGLSDGQFEDILAAIEAARERAADLAAVGLPTPADSIVDAGTPPSVAAESGARGAEPPAVDAAPLRRATVLVVDDNATSADFLASALRVEHPVLVANSGEEALRVAADPEVALSLVLLDLDMPTMHGLEVCRRLKSSPATARIPVLFISASRSAADEESGLEAGALDFIHKPFSPSLVRARIRNHLRLFQYEEELRRASEIDELTGLANRRALNEHFDREWRTAQRTGEPLALLLIDVDHFKAYNDALGHLAGDECLTTVAGVLASSVRGKTDGVARWGGEEFALLLPGETREGVERVAMRLLEAVRSLELPHPAPVGGPYLSVSIGGAFRDTEDRRDPDALLAAADEALYRAKDSGRDRAVISGS